MAQHRIFVPTLGPSNWRAFLAEPFLHWRREKSAWELAVSWEVAAKTNSGMPTEVVRALTSNPNLVGAELLLAIPEHRVTLDDDRRPSQSDLWVVLWTPKGYVSVAIEAKAGEEFDKPIEQWLKHESSGKERRLTFLTKELGLVAPPPGFIRYQLVHRTVAAILEAKRCHFELALMLVQSFDESPSSWIDYEKFANLLGVSAIRGGITGPRQIDNISLYLGWIDTRTATDAEAATTI
jgi:hypothetical protein